MDHMNVEQIKQKLELQREEILRFLAQLESEMRSLEVDCTPDIADRAVVGVQKESLFERSSQRRTLLRLIEAALRRIADGSFGECSACGSEISAGRLQVLPWTQFCLICQEAIEEEVGASLSAHSAISSGAGWRRAG